MSELKPCPFCGESKLLYSGGCGFRYDDDDNQIRLFRVHCRTCKGRTGLFESLDEAIEAWNRRTNSTTIQPSALGTNLAEVGTDAVSREAVKELAYSQIRSMYCGVALKEQRETMLRIADNVIGLLPSVTPKQLTGKWIDTGGNEEWYAREYKCSECGGPMIGETNFCPNCGAKMEVKAWMT